MKEDVYDEKIAPLMTEIIKTCQENGIGMYFTVELDNDGTPQDPNFTYCTTSLPGESLKLKEIQHFGTRYIKPIPQEVE